MTRHPDVARLAAWATLAFTLAAGAAGIEWVQPYEDGLRQAREAGSSALVDFHAGWCGWCKAMDKDVFTDPRVVEALAGYVCIKVDVDREPQVAMAHRVASLPRLLVLNAEGEVKADRIGFLDADALLGFLREVASDGGDGTTGGGASAPALAALKAQLEEPATRDRERLPAECLSALTHRETAVRDAARKLVRDHAQAWLPAIRAAALDNSLAVRIAARQTLEELGTAIPPFDPWAPREERTRLGIPWLQTERTGTIQDFE